jgi:acetolactate synthase I/III small subunit
VKNHVISVLVENKPGVLARISSMFARRGFNIHSLAVGPTMDPDMSRITLVVDGPEMEQIIKQLYKLVHVVKVTELAQGEGVEREVMLLRVSTESTQRSDVLDTARIFDASAVDVGLDTITFELTGDPARLADFLELMRPYGVIDIAKSGRIALKRDPKSRDAKKPKLRSA